MDTVRRARAPRQSGAECCARPRPIYLPKSSRERLNSRWPPDPGQRLVALSARLPTRVRRESRSSAEATEGLATPRAMGPRTRFLLSTRPRGERGCRHGLCAERFDRVDCARASRRDAVASCWSRPATSSAGSSQVFLRRRSPRFPPVRAADLQNPWAHPPGSRLQTSEGRRGHRGPIVAARRLNGSWHGSSATS